MKKTKYALVLSGGGFKGAFQLGALNYLADHWEDLTGSPEPMSFDLIAGVSVGALNGAFMAQNRLEELNTLWQKVAQNGVEEIYTSEFIDTASQEEKVKLKLNLDRLKERFIPHFKVKISLWKGLGLLSSKKKRERFFKDMVHQAAREASENLTHFRSLADNSPLHAKLTQHLDKDAVQDCTYYCGFVSLEDGKYYAVPHHDFTTNEDYVRGVLASSAMPIIWDPVEPIHFLDHRINNAVDGGIRNNSPLGDLIKVINDRNEKDSEYVFIVINCNTGRLENQPFAKANIAQIALRSLNEIAQAEIFENDLDQFLKINDLVAQTKTVAPHVKLKQFNSIKGLRTNKELRRFRAMIIKPGDGVLGDMLTLNPASFERRLQHGQQKAEECLNAFIQSTDPVTVRGGLN